MEKWYNIKSRETMRTWLAIANVTMQAIILSVVVL